MRLASEPLKIEPRVGFFATAPGRLEPAPLVPVPLETSEERPGSGIIEDLRELPLPESEKAGEVGFGASEGLTEARAASRTSLRNLFLVEAKSARCSSGTVSLFFSIKPSA